MARQPQGRNRSSRKETKATMQTQVKAESNESKKKTITTKVPEDALPAGLIPASFSGAFENTSYEMNITSNKLSESARVELIELCNARLADAVDLQLQCKHAHWNVKGPNFIALHELFAQVNDDVEDYIDLIAERAVQLGGIANSTERIVPTWSHLTENDAPVTSGDHHVQTIASALAAFSELTRQAIEKSNGLSDFVSADIFTEITRGVDKWRWIVDAHLQQ
jgi:starvation-inducible DNA-binding protein